MRDRTTSVKPLSPDGSSSRPVGVREDGGTVLLDVWLVFRSTTELLDRTLVPSGLNADEFAVYSVLSVQGGLTPSELAGWMAAPPTTVSSYVKRFESRGHVTRVPNPEDRRSYRIVLTDEGRRVHRDAAARFVPVLGEVVGALDRPEPDVAAALASLRAALDAARGAG